MRQLDLFGSLFNPPLPEEKPAEKQPAAKKEEQFSAAVSTEPATHSKVDLAEETLLVNNNETGTQQEEPEDEKNALKHDRAISPLFEVPAQENAEELFINEVGNVVNEQEPIAFESAEQLEAVSIVENEVEAEEKSQSSKATDKVADTIPADFVSDITPAEKSSIGKDKKEKAKKPLQKRGRKSFKEIEADVDLIEIPEDDVLFQKQYYPISEVAKWFKVNTSLLRFWENEFDVLKPKKNRKGDRLFRPEDVKNLQLIHQLLRQRKYTIEGAKEYLKTNGKKANTEQQVINILEKFRNFLLDLKANL